MRKAGERQQSIQAALDRRTGEPVGAESLFLFSDADFAAMRRAALAQQYARRRAAREALKQSVFKPIDQADEPRFTCLACGYPVWLSRQHREDGNRWFRHERGDDRPECAWVDFGVLSPDQVKAMRYRGQQEGETHQRLKNELALQLARTDGVRDINVEQVTFSAVAKGEWRRPDVRCVYRGEHVVFEIQVSYLFLSDVIARDAFYRREGTHVIWVFAQFQLERAAQSDEAFFNRRNLFVFDQQAIAASRSRSELTFIGFHQKIELDTDGREPDPPQWVSRSVGLSELIFCPETFRPYFFDVEAALRLVLEARDPQHEAQASVDLVFAARAERERVRAERIAPWSHEAVQRAGEVQRKDMELRSGDQHHWERLVQAYRDAALVYCEFGYRKRDDLELLDLVAEMQRNGNWNPAYGVMTTQDFYGEHEVLPVLFSIKYNRPIGYDYDSASEVVNSVTNLTGRRPRAVLYFWAVKHYKPTLTELHRRSFLARAHKLKASVSNGEPEYLRDLSIEPAVALLFPELKPYLADEFASSLSWRLPGF